MRALMIVGLALCLFVGMASPGAAQSGGKKKVPGYKVTILHSNRVYYPKPARAGTYKKVGLVSSATILNATPEYKRIKTGEVKRGSAEFELLLKRASDRFKRAVRATVSLGGYDMIAEKGAVTVAGRVLPDITSTVVNNLPKI